MFYILLALSQKIIITDFQMLQDKIKLIEVVFVWRMMLRAGSAQLVRHLGKK